MLHLFTLVALEISGTVSPYQRLEVMTKFHLIVTVFTLSIYRRSASRSLAQWDRMRTHAFKLDNIDIIQIAQWAEFEASQIGCVPYNRERSG